MRKIIKVFFAFLFACPFSLLFSQSTYAMGAYIDPSGEYICITTEDTHKTSDIYYNTIGLSVSRGLNGTNQLANGTGTEYVMYRINQSQVRPVLIGGIETNVFMIPISEFKNKISGDWAAEIDEALEGNGSASLRVDCVMIIFDYNNISGGMSNSGTLYGTTYTNRPPEDGRNPSEIMRARGWRNPSGLVSHFNQWLVLGHENPKPKEAIVADEYNVKITEELSPLEYATGNSSPQGYNIGEGIPSSKDITNEYYASRWHGGTEVWARTVLTSQYTGIEYEMNWDLEVEVPTYDEHGRRDGTRIEYIPQPAFRGTFDEHIRNTASMVPAVAFEYLVNAEFYDLASTGIYNLAYPSTIYYPSEHDTPMKAVTTGTYVDIATEGPGQAEIETWFADTAKHVTWAAIDTSRKTVDLGSFRSESEARRVMEDKFVGIKENLQSQVYSGTITKNDELMVDSVDYMTPYNSNGVNWTEDGSNPGYAFCTNSAAMQEPFVIGSISGASVEKEEGTQTVTIPPDTDNGKYPTGMEVIYTKKIQFNRMSKIFYADSAGEWFSGKSNYELLSNGHCLDAFNGYIHVHTPVISPVRVLNDSGEEIDAKTQLQDGVTNADATYQLLLDEDYILDWENEVHRNIALYGESGKYSKYDEFVEKKWVRFPFEVEYNGKYYDTHPVNETMNEGAWTISGNYTDWILIEAPVQWNDEVNLQLGTYDNGWQPSSSNHWRQTPIYIPSYAKETGRLGEEAFVYYKVEAINSDGRYGGDHTREQEAIFNKNYTYEYADDGAKYVATYKFQVQLSGLIYDFMITGSSDKDTFMYEYTGTQIKADHVPFCKYKMEKRVGKLNRFADVSIRYRTDGMLTQTWDDVNTLPLMAGKSTNFEKMGYVIKGSRFSYSFKTIANLDSTGDSVTIKPTFRYIRNDGSETNNIKVYYKSPISEDVMVEYGSDRDLRAQNTQKVKLIHKQFNESYYDELNSWVLMGASSADYQIGDWINYTTKYYNDNNGSGYDLTPEEFMNRETQSFNLSKIVLNSDLRLLSGEWEQLKRNTKGIGREYENILRYCDKAYSEEGASGLSNWNNDLQNRFRKSMQTWYGQYYIPAELYIVDLDDPETQDLISDAGQTPDDSFDLTQYITEYLVKEKGQPGIRDDDEIFITEGNINEYLVINFDIKTSDEGKRHLQYYGTNSGSKDMWKTEGFPERVVVGETVDHEIPVHSGDVAIVDLSLSVKDKYKAAIFNIN